MDNLYRIFSFNNSATHLVHLSLPVVVFLLYLSLQCSEAPIINHGEEELSLVTASVSADVKHVEAF